MISSAAGLRSIVLSCSVMAIYNLQHTKMSFQQLYCQRNGVECVRARHTQSRDLYICHKNRGEAFQFPFLKIAFQYPSLRVSKTSSYLKSPSMTLLKRRNG